MAAVRTGDEYRERVHAPRWLAVLVWVSLGLLVVVLVGVVRDPEMPPAAAVPVIAVLMVGAAVLLVAIRWLLVLEISVRDGVVSFGYGPFGKQLSAGEIESIKIERYRWLIYGGWGIRFSTGRRRAYSVPFRPRGVGIRTRGGKRYHVTSDRPEALLAAIAGVIGSGSR
jgi:hypothetical protein